MSTLNLSDHYQSAEQLTEGKWVTLECGLEAWVCRSASPLFHKAFAQQQRRYGLDKKRRKVDADKALRALCGTMARSMFRGFRVPGDGDVVMGGEVIEDSVANREEILYEYPDLREEISNECEALAVEFEEEAEGTGKD